MISPTGLSKVKPADRLHALDLKPLAAHLASWNYDMSLKSSHNFKSSGDSDYFGFPMTSRAPTLSAPRALREMLCGAVVDAKLPL